MFFVCFLFQTFSHLICFFYSCFFLFLFCCDCCVSPHTTTIDDLKHGTQFLDLLNAIWIWNSILILNTLHFKDVLGICKGSALINCVSYYYHAVEPRTLFNFLLPAELKLQLRFFRQQYRVLSFKTQNTNSTYKTYPYWFLNRLHVWGLYWGRTPKKIQPWLLCYL